jgi:hypothetical protein
MRLRSTIASPGRLLRRITVPATLVIVSAGYFVSCAWFASAEDEVRAKAKAKHLPATAMRDRMLATFHGKTTEMFTAIPGFGMERMPPLYKTVPFEIPDLSTNEVEVETEIVPPQSLKDVFTKSLEGFRDPAKPIAAKNKDFGPFGSTNGFGGVPGVIQRGLQLRLLDLVGLMNADGPRVYSGGKAFEIQRMTAEEIKAARAKNPNSVLDFSTFRPGIAGKAKVEPKDHPEAGKLETRPLDVFESTGVAELRDGKDLFIRTRGNVIRMLGALRATENCLECHTDNKKGDLLGAFSYTFVDLNNTVTKELKRSSTN